MQSKEEIENMKKYFSECILKDTVYEEELTINFMKVAKEHIKQLETEVKEVTIQRNKLATILSDKEDDKQKLIVKLEEDKIEQFDDYVIYLIESYLKILKGENDGKRNNKQND